MIRFIGLPGTNDPYVKINFYDDKTSILFSLADQWSHDSDIIIDVNAVDNGTHSAKTFHGKSLAWDLDTEGDKSEDLKSLFSWLKEQLPPPYEIILESDHIHVEWDTHR